jgi:hypothetical protein
MEPVSDDERYDKLIRGLGVSSKEMAKLIVDALVDGKVVDASNFDRGVDVTTEEIWVRQLLVDETKRNSDV